MRFHMQIAERLGYHAPSFQAGFSDRAVSFAEERIAEMGLQGQYVATLVEVVNEARGLTWYDVPIYASGRTRCIPVDESLFRLVAASAGERVEAMRRLFGIPHDQEAA